MGSVAPPDGLQAEGPEQAGAAEVPAEAEGEAAVHRGPSGVPGGQSRGAQHGQGDSSFWSPEPKRSSTADTELVAVPCASWDAYAERSAVSLVNTVRWYLCVGDAQLPQCRSGGFLAAAAGRDAAAQVCSVKARLSHERNTPCRSGQSSTDIMSPGTDLASAPPQAMPAPGNYCQCSSSLLLM